MEEAVSDARDFAVAVSDTSHVAAARSAAQQMARTLEFNAVREGRIGIVVTEAATNMLKHASGGTLAVRALARGSALGIELLAIDSGPGMESVADSSRDGVSTAGTRGTGLGAMQRQSDEFEVYSRPRQGTIVRMALWQRDPPPFSESHEVGAICVAKPGESVCGDAWGVEFHDLGATFLVADGLGHGADASRASTAAVEVLRRLPGEDPVRILDTAHGRLRPTRGAAVAVMRHDAVHGEVAFVGVGNIAAVVLDSGERRSMISHNGIVGHNLHKSHEYRYGWHKGGLLVAHSDGLETQWDLAPHQGLLDCHASIIAAHLYRQHSRRRDDCTVVVARSLH
jgi:anti-sigma regulatory factor (Ser/Thr protein kinase)